MRTELRFPVDGLKDATRGGWGDGVVGDTLDFHFRSSETGEVAGYVEFDAVGHGIVQDLIFGK